MLRLLLFNIIFSFYSLAQADQQVRIRCAPNTLITFKVTDNFFGKTGYKNTENMWITKNSKRKRIHKFRVAKKSVSLQVRYIDSSNYNYRIPISSFSNTDNPFNIKVSYTSVDQWTPDKYDISCVFE